MEAILERCCGIDVHKKSLTACLLVGKLSEKPVETVRTFSTMTIDLLELQDWLVNEGCTRVAIESTGVYWKPVFNILEDSVTVILANASHIKHVAGRKTDVKDCQWIAQLLRCGLVEASFIPPLPIRELRELTRYRRQILGDLAAEKNRVQATLEDANIKLSSVATDIFGVSGQAILEELLNGNSDASEMAKLAKGRLRSKSKELEQALKGKMRDHHRFMILCRLSHIKCLYETIGDLDAQIDACMEPFRKECELLQEIPGVKKKTAESIIAEIGIDMSVFPTDAHLSSWAGMCPGSNESAGKRRSGRTTGGDTWLKTTLIEAGWAASRTKGSYFKGQFHRMSSRRGAKRAVVAVGHSILVASYHMLKDGCHYHELGENYFEKQNAERIKRQAVKRLQDMGYKVTLTPQEEAA